MTSAPWPVKRVALFTLAESPQVREVKEESNS
jgi:hypothetical protein